MQARTSHGTDGFALFHRGIEIGEVASGKVTFAGFTTRDDAALAASLAHHALRRRRARDGQRKRPGGSRADAVIRWQETPDGDRLWAFDVELMEEERQGVFATSRARTMWSALRAAGLDRRMRQLRDETLATAGNGTLN